MAHLVKSTVKNNEVFVSLSDVIRSLYTDKREIKNTDLNASDYIEKSIIVWETYEDNILEEAGLK